MRFTELLAGLATLLVISSQNRADSQNDLDQCKLVGETNKADQSITACDQVLLDPNITRRIRVTALSNRCGWWWIKQDPDRALSDCNAAIRVDPTYALAYVNRANAYLGKGDSEQAFANFDEAIRLDPKSAWAYVGRGNSHKNNGDLDHALADFNESIRLDPYYAPAYFHRGYLYRNKGNFDGALADLNESIRLDPNYALAYFNRGCVGYTMGNNAVAIDDFTKSIRLDPNYALAYFSRGVAYFVIGAHLADAEADFRKANELNPKDAYAALWLDLAERRNNVPSHLAQTAKHLDMTAWPAPLIRQFLGELSPAEALVAGERADPKTNLAEVCEANFYSGEWALLNGRKQEALRLWKLAANDCPPGLIEINAAIVEPQ